MKVIKEGKISNFTEVFTGTCYSCGCEVEVDEYDVKEKVRSSPFAFDVKWNYVNCPTVGCNKEIIV